MKRILLTTLLALTIGQGMDARSLVITLSNGQRLAFGLDEQNVVMTEEGNQLYFNGYSINRIRITEFRIFEQAPADAIQVGIKDLATGKTTESSTIVDLSGRPVQHLKPGIYVINRKKVVIR